MNLLWVVSEPTSVNYIKFTNLEYNIHPSNLSGKIKILTKKIEERLQAYYLAVIMDNKKIDVHNTTLYRFYVTFNDPQMRGITEYEQNVWIGY
jgi:hypothetical protein